MFYQDFSPSVKCALRVIVLIFSIGVTFAVFSVAYFYAESGKQAGHDITHARQLSVVGEGKVSVTPDIALFTATVVTQSVRVGDAQSENTKRANTVAEFLKKLGVAKKDMQTTGYAITPQYTSNSCTSFPCPSFRPSRISSYEVRNTLEVKIRDLSKLDDALEGVVKNGANEVGSVSFTLDNSDVAKADARKKAIADASSKAEVLAHDLRVRLKKIISFSESGGGIPIYYDRLQAFNGVGGGSEPAPTPKLEAGEQEIISRVTILYEFR